MKTRCPSCQTTFRVTPEQLKARAGKVRCGQCQSVFNALDSLVDEPLAAPSAVPPGRPHTVTETTPALGTPIEDTPDTQPIPETQADPAISILLEPMQATGDRVEPGLHPEPQDGEEPVPPLSEAEAQELGKATGLILPREMTEVPGYSKWSAGIMTTSLNQEPEKPARWPYVLVAIVLTAVLLGQLAFRFRSELAITIPSARPALEAACRLLDTDIPLPRHVDLVSIEASDLQSDAGRGNLLVLNATVRNRAGYPQAFPSLELSLTDTQDNPIARRVFPPEEYLPARLKVDQPFAAHADIAVRLWIEAEDISAAGYRLYVFYP